MSMISAQCDELRERAKELRNLAPDPDVPYLVPSTKEIMALAMRSAAGEMEDAADTIWQLRCRLVDAEDRVRKSGELCKLCDLADENAKLRELVADALLSTKDYAEKHGGPSNAFDASDWRIVHLRSRGRELGVEVD